MNKDSSSNSIMKKSDQLYKKEIPSYIKTRDGFNNEDNPRFDYGIFNRYKLDDLINIQSDGFNQSKVQRFAFIQNNAIHLEQSILNLFQKYAKFQIAFISIYGKLKSGKSLLLDKILNLAEFEGSNFTKMIFNQAGIYIWNTPFTKGNLKIFMLDIQGYNQKQISKAYSMLLSFMILLSSSLILLAQPSDHQFQQLSTIYSHLKRSTHNIISTRNQQHIPSQLYCLFRQNQHNKYEETFNKIFPNINLVIIRDALSQKAQKMYDSQQLKELSMKIYDPKKNILNQQYIKKISFLVRDIYGKIMYKTIHKLRFTGTNLIKICLNTIQHLNIKQNINIQNIFMAATKQLYRQAYNFHIELYNDNLSTYLQNEEPYEVDVLIKIFRQSNQIVYNSFKSLTIHPQMRQKYLQKMEKYINNKQKIIMAINKKKYEQKIDSMKSLDNNISVNVLDQAIKKMKVAPKKVEQVYIEKIIPQMATVIKKVEQKQKQGNIINKGMQLQTQYKLKEFQLKNILASKSKINQQVIENKQLYLKKQKQLNENIKIVKNLLAKSKDIQIKKSREVHKSPQILVKQIQYLKNEIKQKEKIIKQLKNNPETRKSIEMISSLNSMIQTKVNKQKQLQLMLASIPKINSLNALKSITSSVSPLNARKVQSRVFNNKNANIKIISSPKV